MNLWFEDDLFCQVNFWFCVYLLSSNKTLKLYRIFPKTNEKNHWKGFSVSSSSELQEALNSKISINSDDNNLILKLWKSFQNKDEIELERLSLYHSTAFRNLDSVIKIYLEKEYEQFILNLIKIGIADFNEIYKKFQQEFEMLGFGDLQVIQIIKKAL